MNIQDLINGLNNGSITILGNHRTNNLVEKLEGNIEHCKKIIAKYEPLIGTPVKKGEANPESMIRMSKENLEVTLGCYLGTGSEIYCFDCGSTMYIIPISETEIAYVNTHRYWDIADASGEKYDFLFKKEHVEECSCCTQRKAKKLVSEIDVPTGELVFVNFFREKDLSESEEMEYAEPSINSILGRDNLMQHLATKNVGYGQMGNMSITIYSNESNEIIIGDSMCCYLDNKKYYQKHPEELVGKHAEDFEKEKNKAEAFLAYLDAGGFKIKGEISLSMWRWMCADKSVVKNAKEKVDKKETVTLKVNSGKWKIEHYFDFAKREDVLFSKLTLV